MAEPIRERLLADAAAQALQPLEAYRRLFPGREDEVARAWREASGTSSTGSSNPNLEDATRSVISLEALRDAGFARLRVGETLGVGGMGEVLAARDDVLRRNLALKRVRTTNGEVPGGDDGASTGGPDAPLVRRLLEEAQITAQLDHPGVVPVHELGVDDAGRPYFTMKRVHGHTLSELLRREREGRGRSLARTLQVFVRICETLAYAHRKGVVHRDVKPANVMIGRFGEVYLMDWGLAKLRDDAQDPTPSLPEPGATGVITTYRSEQLRQGADAALTQHDQVVGTLGYLSPEQLVGGAVDERSDVYAVGAMLYELLSGHAPYCEPDAKRDARRTFMRLLEEPPTPLAACAPEAPPELVAIAEKALARDPRRRFASAQELAEELHAFLEGRVVRSHRTGVWIEVRKWVGRNRWLALGLLAALVAAAGTATAFVAQQRRAAVDVGRERDRAQAEALRAHAAGRRADGLRLAAQSRLVTGDPGLALALAVEAGRRAPGAASSGAIYHALRRHREGRYFAGHESYVTHGAWNAAGTRFLSADATGLLVLWDTDQDAVLRWFDGPQEEVVALALAPDDRRAATAHTDGLVRVWDLEAGSEEARLDFNATSLRFLAPQELLLAGAAGTTERWHIGDERREVLDRQPGPVRLAEGIETRATRVALTAAGRLVLLDLGGGAARVVDGPPDAQEPLAVQSTGAGQVLVRWGAGDARAYGLVDGAELRRLGEGFTLMSAGFSGDGSRLALGLRPPGAEPRVVVLDAATGSSLASMAVDASVALLPTRDGRAFAAVDREQATWVELEPKPRIVPLRGHRYTIAHGALSPDERHLATVSHDMTVRVWSLRPQEERIGLVPRVAAKHRVLGWSQDTTRALVATPNAAGGSGTLEVVDAATGRVAARFENPGAEVDSGGLDATGGQAWWVAGRAWRVADVATGQLVRSTRLAVAAPQGSGAFPSPNGRWVAIHADDHLAILDQATGAEVGRVGQGRQPMRPTWAPDDTHLIVAHPPLALSALYRYDGAEPLREFGGHSGFVTDARADPLGRWVVSVAADSTVRLYELASGRLLSMHRGLPLRGARLALSPRSDLVAVTTSKHVLLHIGPDGALREAASLDREPEEQLFLHPDGRRFALVDEQQRARLWDLDAVAEGRRALRRPVLRVDGVPDYEPDADDPLDAAWLARPDAWWTLERAQHLMAQGRLDEAEQAVDQAAALRPRWAAPDLERARLAALRATARGASVADAVTELLPLLATARSKGAQRLVAHAWHAVPRELAPYASDARLAAALRDLDHNAR